MKVAFASCSSIKSRYQAEQPIWGLIRKQQPNLLLLLGDNVYIGKEGYEPTFPESISPPDRLGAIAAPLTTIQLKEGILASKYEAQVNEHNFKLLLQQVPYLAIWDNHDFGLPGDTYESIGPDPVPVYGAEVSKDHRDMARKLFDRYLKNGSAEPDTEEVYCKHEVKDNGKFIKFFMLDVRSHQENPVNLIAPRAPSLLGQDQEDWFLRELKESTADVNVICSGIPYRYWRNYPRWYDAFNKVARGKSKLLFLGGQVHHNEFNEILLLNNPSTELMIPDWIDALDPPGEPALKRIMYEAVSSGVGQNLRAPDDEDPDPEPRFKNNEDIIENPGLLTLPRNNYGVIDFTENLVIITLYGQFVDDMHYAVIDRNDWTLKGYWSMQRTRPD